MWPVDTMWAVAGGIIIGGVVLAMARGGVTLVTGDTPYEMGIGAVLLIVALTAAVWITSKVYGIH